MINSISDSVNKIRYKGNISVKILKNNRVLREKTFTNNGRWPLFLHLVNSLCGNYENADKNRPLFLALYSVPYKDTDNGKTPTITDSGSDENKISTYAKKSNLVTSSPGQFMVAPKPTVTENEGIGSANVTYKFLIPFQTLDTREEHSWPDYQICPINLVCLYSRSNSFESSEGEVEKDTYGNPSAFFFVPETPTSLQLGSLLPKDVTTTSDEYSLEVDWTLTFTNSGTSVIPVSSVNINWVDNIYHKIYTNKETGDTSVFNVTDTYIQPITYGKVPVFDGYIPRYDSNEYEYKKLKYIPKSGTTGAPASNSHNYTYVFAGWTPDIDVATSDTTYTASYWQVDSNGNIIDEKPITEYPE